MGPSRLFGDSRGNMGKYGFVGKKTITSPPLFSKTMAKTNEESKTRCGDSFCIDMSSIRANLNHFVFVSFFVSFFLPRMVVLVDKEGLALTECPPMEQGSSCSLFRSGFRSAHRAALTPVPDSLAVPARVERFGGRAVKLFESLSDQNSAKFLSKFMCIC